MFTKEEIEAIKDQNKKSSQRQDFKQHCQKILEGIGRFDDNTASRAVWELLQNARDLSEHAHVRIVLDEDKLVISHNGEPFVYDTFTSLIKQVSSAGKEDPNAAGQFGTGFMTTHKFSRKIRIDGCMKVAEKEYAPIENFQLDRTADEIQSLIDAMGKQIEYADHLIDGELISEPVPETIFTYYLDSDRLPAAEQGVNNALELLPYVMVINDRIERVEITGTKVESPIIIEKEQSQCIDEETNLYEVLLVINEVEIKKVYYLQSDDRKDIVILPLESIDKAIQIGNVPRFFIFFPLLGTENFGLNYIFHSERFYPEEPRNAIVLPENNVDKKVKYEENVQILNEMSEMLFRFLHKFGGSISNARYLAEVNIDIHEQSHQLTHDYYEELKKQFIDEFLTIPFVDVNTERASVLETAKVKFLAPEIVSFLHDEECASFLDVVYEYAASVAPLPNKEECIEWSSVVGEWDATASDRFVSIENIVLKITAEDDKKKLYSFIEFLKSSKQLDNFPNAEIFPNREGKLKNRQYLRDAIDVTDLLYQVARPLIPHDTDRFVDNDFRGLYSFVPYSRDDLKKSINDYVNSHKEEAEPFKDTLPALLDYCSVFPVQNGNSLRNNAMPYICELFGHNYKEQYQAPLPEVEADKEQNLYRTAFDVLVDFTLRTIANRAAKNTFWFSQNRQLHMNILIALSNKDRTTQYQSEAFLKYAIIPDQEGHLHKSSELKALVGIDAMKTEVKVNLYSIYEKVFNSSLGKLLVDEAYQRMCVFEKLEPRVICRDIDDALAQNKYKSPVAVEIIELLDRNADSCWKEWFKNIDDNKAEIFLSRLEGNDRTSTYKFIKADSSKKELILKLIDRPDLETLVKKADELIQNEHEKRIVFNQMLSIGKEIEKKLRAHLDETLWDFQYRKQDEKMIVGDVQDGQDIVVYYKGNPIYYIEVKSKWNFKDPAHMSVNQMRQAVRNADRYALCCVELTDYNSNEVENISIQTILDHCYVHLDIGHDLSKLIQAIVDDNSDEEYHIKIKDYVCNMNKGFFVSSQYVGIDSLVNDIVSKIN